MNIDLTPRIKAKCRSCFYEYTLTMERDPSNIWAAELVPCPKCTGRVLDIIHADGSPTMTLNVG